MSSFVHYNSKKWSVQIETRLEYKAQIWTVDIRDFGSDTDTADVISSCVHSDSQCARTELNSKTRAVHAIV